MVGLVIVAHGNLGTELLKVAEVIVGPMDKAEVISIGTEVDMDSAGVEIGAAIKRVQGGRGVLVFTDMFGGTPANLSLSFLDPDNVEVLTGVNLPMLIKFANHRKDKDVKDLVPIVKEGGMKSIIIASDMMKQKAKK